MATFNIKEYYFEIVYIINSHNFFIVRNINMLYIYFRTAFKFGRVSNDIHLENVTDLRKFPDRIQRSIFSPVYNRKRFFF